MTTSTLPFVAAAPWAGFGRTAKAAFAARNNRRAARSLNHLDAHLLRDIGLAPPVEDPHTILRRAMMAQ